MRQTLDMPFRLWLVRVLLVIQIATPLFGQSPSVVANQRGLFPVYDHGHCGYIDSTGVLVIQLKYRFCLEFSEGLAAVSLDRLSYGFIDEQGVLVIPYMTQLGEPGSFSEGLAVVRNQEWSKQGFIDRTGKVQIELKYQEAHNFSEGLAWVRIDDKWGAIDTKGEIRVTPKFSEDPDEFHDGLALFMKRLRTADCSQSKDFSFRQIDDFLFINRSGDIVKAPTCQSFACDNLYQSFEDHYCGSYSESLAPIQSGHKWGFQDTSGKVVIPPQFDSVGEFSEGLVMVRIADRRGYIDHQGMVVIKPQFVQAMRFSDGLAAVSIDGKWGYIDATGAVVIKPQFERAGEFRHGVARIETSSRSSNAGHQKIRMRSKWTYINKQGKILWKWMNSSFILVT